nr:hypothetical protein B0A51_17292 [Rachicladosporium sp. CCFEE 5018]OQO17202.1 hypothetical protein B0A51_15167 [Rachicladosporium sp. CCFEE 5018]
MTTIAPAMESPTNFPESPLEGEGEDVYPCKGCGEILEEGKAFELAGNRWHIDCFRCNTCGTLLDSDANLLLLGDGSLICNNCTYSCNACGNKIEDLAILTGDQAFCASCFRCRNCKRKIENLRYARTSQGIFCMSCHESLMARRRKKSKGTPRPSAPSATRSGSAIEKALPSLPPGAAPEAAFSPDSETPPMETYTAGTNANSPPPRALRPTKDGAADKFKRDVSPMSDEARRDGQTLPASTYKESRSSHISSGSDDGENEGFLPMAFDPAPAPRPPQIARKKLPQSSDLSQQIALDSPPPRDYFAGRSASKPHRDALREDRSVSSRSASTERDPSHAATLGSTKPSPHIAYQDKSRAHKKVTSNSGQSTPGALSTAQHSPSFAGATDRTERPKAQTLNTGSYTLGPGEGFKLQEVPKEKRAASRSSSSKENRSPVIVSPVDAAEKGNDRLEPTVTASPVSTDSPQSGVNPFDDPRRREGPPSAAPPAPPKFQERPTRGDSLATGQLKPSASVRSTPPTPTTSLAPNAQLSAHSRDTSSVSIPASFTDAQSTISAKTVESPTNRSSFDVPPRASSRPMGAPKPATNNDFVTPRLPPPPPPPAELHRTQESISTRPSTDSRSDAQRSPALLSAGLQRQSTDGGFNMEEEMARILRGEKANRDSHPEATQSVLRRVSKAVKHGRSFSDRGATATKSPSVTAGEVPGTPMTISSPIMTSPAAKESVDSLRASLRRAQQKITQLETEKQVLEEKVNSSSDIRQVNSELKEKRSTMAFLDTQREMVVRELEVMTNHLGKAKDSNQPLDMPTLKDSVLQELSESLNKLKDHMGSQIEDLIRRRNELTDEITNLIQMKDKGFQEYDILSTKNEQLERMNNQLTQNFQEFYKSNRGANGGAPDVWKSGATNGLGIYHPGAKPDSQLTSEMRSLNLVSTDSSLPNLLHETEAEPATILTAPQMVNIRKGQPKKFNWRKGGAKAVTNVTKGLKGAFANNDRVTTRDGLDIGVPYSSTQQTVAGSEQSSINSKQGLQPNGLGWLAQKNGGLKAGSLGSTMRNGSSTNLTIAAGDGSVLFGTELELRCDYEKRVIPIIVTRCIEEVEARGMDVEGVYRKSGGSGQVKNVQAGFEKEGTFDVSDEDLDIHAVTSTLKQYFRKLPTPLITYDVYDTLLEAGQTSTVGDREQQMLALRAAVHELPEAHRNCLEILICHLARVMTRQEKNLMTPLNLAVVFAPTIMRPLSIEREMNDMLLQRTAVQAMIELCDGVFGEEE